MRVRPGKPFGLRSLAPLLVPAVVLAAMLAWPGTSVGQLLFPIPEVGASGYPRGAVTYGGDYDWGGVVMRLHHHNQNYGEEAGKTAFGLNKTFVYYDQIALFADGSYRVDYGANSSWSGGGGFRFIHPNWLVEGAPDRIFGTSFWYDGDQTGNYFEQFGVSLESLGDRWDFRLNLNVPVGKREQDRIRVPYGEDDLMFKGHALCEQNLVFRETSMLVLEAEVARRLGERNLWTYAGCYYLDGGGERLVGYKGGFRGYLTNDLSVDLRISHDDLFDTTVAFGVTWFFDFVTRSRAQMSPANVVDRLRAPVRRNDYVVLWQRWQLDCDALTDIYGDEFHFIHVDSNAAAGGDGTFENPYSSLAEAEANSEEGNYIFMHRSSVFDGESITLKDQQSLLGEGVADGHEVQTAQFDDPVLLPDRGGPVPIIQNAPGTAVTLADENVVSGMTIDGATTGIRSSGGVDEVDISGVTIQNTTGNGIVLTPRIVTSDDVPDDQQHLVGIWLNPTIDDVTFNNNVGGDDIVIDSRYDKDDPDLAALTVYEEISIANVTSNDANGYGIRIESAPGTVTIEDCTYNGGTTGAGGILLNNLTGTATVTGSTINDGTGYGLTVHNNQGTVTVEEFAYDGGTTGGGGMLFDVDLSELDPGETFTEGTYSVADSTMTAGAGPGVRILESDGTYTFTDTEITDTGGAAFNVEDGSATAGFTGKITQGANAEAVLVTGGHTGTLVFTPVTTPDETDDEIAIEATAGTGLQFNEADGTYAFGKTVLNGGDAGVDVIDSDGALTFSDATITSPTGIAFNVEGGAASASFTGIITQANNAAAVNVSDHSGDEHTGSLAFTALPTDTDDDPNVVEATNGTGLQFTKADGTYTFGKVTLNGGDAGIDIIDADGSLSFSDATITSPTGAAFNVEGGAASASLTGIITQANNAAAVNVSEFGGEGHTGSLTFTALPTDTDDDPNVVEATDGTGLQFTNVDGTYTFGKVTLAGGDAGVDILGGTDDYHGSQGSFSFSDATITDPTGVAFNVEASEATVAFTGKITQSNDVAAVSVSGHAALTEGDESSLTFTALPSDAEPDPNVIEATNGTGLQFANADGTYTFGKVTLNGGDAGIDILAGTDASDGSEGTLTFSDATITSPTGAAVNVEASQATLNFTGKITQANAADAVSVSGGDESTLGFTALPTDTDPDPNVIEATDGDGLQFDNADGTYGFGKISLNGGNAGIDILANSEGSFYFTEGEIVNPTNEAVMIDGSEATVSLALTIENNADQSVVVTNNTGGSLSFTGDITDTGEGVLVQNNTETTTTFSGQVDLDTGTFDAVTVDSNTDSTTTFGELVINTTDGDGFVATGDGEVQVTGADSTITTTGAGIGLNISNTTIGSSGVSFDSVSVDGAPSAIVLANVTGGTISVGADGDSVGDGGTIANTTGHAVSITNVESVSLSYLNITGSGGDGIHIEHTDDNACSITLNENSVANSADNGIEVAAAGAGEFTLDLTSNSITGNVGGANESILINVDDPAETVNLTMTDNTVVNNSGDSALALNTTGTTGKTVTVDMEDNSFVNDAAGTMTVDILNAGAVRLEIDVLNNSFTNGGSAVDEFSLETNDAAAVVRLDLLNNSSNSGAGTFELINTAGDYGVWDLPDVGTNNSGTVNTTGAIYDLGTH